MSFTRFPLHHDLLRGVKELGFLRPTPIQEQTIPAAGEGRDVMASAMTGSGKTAAFLLPILHNLMGKPRGTTRALVLTPTRELAAQIHEHLEELAVHTPLTGASVFGGVGMGPQEHAFRSGVDVVIATPGRLLDHLRRPYARLAGLEVLVLDEADRMLDMGFLPDIRKILRQIPANRQTLFFSATMPREIAVLAREMLRNPETVNLERRSAPAVGITQAVYPVHRELKSALLRELLTRAIISDAIVFTRTKHRANRLADYLERHDIRVAKIHGNRSQGQRTEALKGFKAGLHKVLIATDIVSRGIDVEALGHVVNFDVPADPDSYVHRVGRTARAEATGDAFTFVSPDEEGSLKEIERVIGKRLPRVTLPDFDYSKKTEERLEIPLRDRLATHRAAQRGKRPNLDGGHTARSADKGNRLGKGEASGTAHGAGRFRDRGAGDRPRAGGLAPGGSRPNRHVAASGRSSRPPLQESRLQAALDRHAPVSGSAGGKSPQLSAPHQRRRGR